MGAGGLGGMESGYSEGGWCGLWVSVRGCGGNGVGG